MVLYSSLNEFDKKLCQYELNHIRLVADECVTKGLRRYIGRRTSLIRAPKFSPKASNDIT